MFSLVQSLPPQLIHNILTSYISKIKIPCNKLCNSLLQFWHYNHHKSKSINLYTHVEMGYNMAEKAVIFTIG